MHHPSGDLTRRSMLGATAGLAAGLAGCTGGDGGSTPGGGERTQGPMTPFGPTPEGSNLDWDRLTGMAQGGTIHFLTDYSNDPWQDAWQQDIVAPFQTATAATVNIEYTGFAGRGDQRLATLMQAGEPPESFTGGIASALIGQGQLAPVEKTIERITENVGRLRGKAYRLYHQQGDNVYVIPHGQYTDSIHYRADLLEDHGLEPPTTYSEILHNAQVIDESDRTNARGYELPAMKVGKAEDDFSHLFFAHDAHFWQWEDRDNGVADVWFPEEEVVAALELMKELAEFSPDPGGISWGESLSFWAGGRVAQQHNLNAWSAGVAYNAGNVEIAENTEITYMPKVEGVDDPFTIQEPGFDGHPIINASDNPDGARALVEYMYSDPDQIAAYHLIEPTRFLPVYADVQGTDTYQNGQAFQEVPHLLEMNEWALDNLVPKDPDPVKMIYTPATQHARGFAIVPEMVNQAVVADRDPAKAWKEARDRLSTRLDEGNELQEEHYS